MDVIATAAEHRCPNWLYWPPILRFLRDHSTDVITAAPDAVARVVELWLRHAPEGFPFRREAAELGLALGQRALEMHRAYGGASHDHPRRCYRVALLAAVDIPDEVADFALRACERRASAEPSKSGTPDPALLSTSARNHPRLDQNEKLPIPWPDGPQARIDGDFQEVVLDTDVLLPLIRSRPATAREVVLGCLIKPPHRFDWTSHWHERAELEIDSGLRWRPALYIHGPFLAFLSINFAEGLETITRLVDFAAERWQSEAELESRQDQLEGEQDVAEIGPLGPLLAESRRPLSGIVLPLSTGDRRLIGDARVYGWAAGLGSPPSVIEAALMALEQHFYLEIDAGRSIDAKLQAVLVRVRSTAFLKVMCDVGKRENVLFEGVLRPLLAIPEIYRWEIRTIPQGRSHLLIGARMLHGEWFVRIAQAFHGMEHRSRDLRGIAVRLFLFGKAETRQYLSEVRRRWEQEIGSLPPGPWHEFLEQLTVAFDIENYRRVEDPDQGEAYVNVRAQELHAQRAEEHRRSEEQLFLMMLPIQCRKMLDERTVLSTSDLERFWEQLRRAAEGLAPDSVTQSQEAIPRESSAAGAQSDSARCAPATKNAGIFARALRPLRRLCSIIRGQRAVAAESASPDGVAENAKAGAGNTQRDDGVANALAGAAAFLVRQHSEWLAAHPDRRLWCREQLRSAVLTPPPLDGIDVRESTASWTWDCFAAEAVPLLWASDPSDRELRLLVARLVFAPHNVAVQILFARCAEYRLALGADFDRLRRLLFEFAHVRNRISFVEQTRYLSEVLTEKKARHFAESVNAWTNDRITAFVDGSLPVAEESWIAMDDPERFRQIDELRRDWHGHYYLDVGLGICPTKAGWWRGRRSRDARVNEYPKVQKDKRTQSRAE